MRISLSSRKPILTDNDQGVSFAELFFDIVFVFSITQVVHLLHGAFDWVHAGRAILVFWLVWWAWTQFTWALNAADTRHNWVQLGTLIATIIAFFMAVSVPEAFGPYAWWFASSYVAVRGIGLLMYLWVSWSDPVMRNAVIIFSIVSVSGLVSVMVGGLIGGEAQYWLWGLTIVLDIIAASVGGNYEGWNLHPKHFAERHGLFVIIALGETLIVAASAVAKASWESHRMIVSILAVCITSSLWWLYFFRIKERLEHALAQQKGAALSMMGRDVYSLFHFPMLCGLIIYAYAIEEAMTHPNEALTFSARIALALGIFLFSVSLVIAHWRATGKILVTRLIGICLIATLCIFIGNIGAIGSMAIVLAGLITLCLLEH